jgi:hypothetical protein
MLLSEHRTLDPEEAVSKVTQGHQGWSSPLDPEEAVGEVTLRPGVKQQWDRTFPHPHNPTPHNPTPHNPTPHNPTPHNPTPHNPTPHTHHTNHTPCAQDFFYVPVYSTCLFELYGKAPHPRWPDMAGKPCSLLPPNPGAPGAWTHWTLFSARRGKHGAGCRAHPEGVRPNRAKRSRAVLKKILVGFFGLTGNPCNHVRS